MDHVFLQTERLDLRHMRIEDWPDYRDLMASARSVHMGGPHDASAAWGMFCSDAHQWQFFGTGALMIEDRETKACLGQVAVNTGPLYPEHEIGWLLYPQAEGRGIAHEAALAMKNWATHTLKAPSLVSYIDADNARSIALSTRLGGRPDPDARRPHPDDVVYRYY